MNVAWPDIVIGIILLFTTLRGLKRGMVGELTGAVALAFGIGAAFAYTGTFDAFVRDHGHLGPGPGHVIGMVLYAGIAYGIVYILGSALSSIARLPVINVVNALLGMVVGFFKGAVFAWAILYVALFFPLPNDIRGDLHRSQLVAMLQTPDAWLDDQLRGKMPGFLKYYSDPVLDHHRV
ncbi:MAG: CvpA family protein [Candidatus Eremiobacteraeota bacterium]|nr:CvpA family protein [Candidatus Eremiobacteraeota bacterium]